MISNTENTLLLTDNADPGGAPQQFPRNAYALQMDDDQPAVTDTSNNAPCHLPAHDEVDVFEWHDDRPHVDNYFELGSRLARTGDVFRDGAFGQALRIVPMEPGTPSRLIASAQDLGGVIVDRVPLKVYREGKCRGGRFPAGHLQVMLRSEAFLRQFRPIDSIATSPIYLPDFTLTKPGYNDGGVGQRIYYAGPPATIADDTTVLTKFLSVMAFASQADYANALGFALTVMLRNHFQGGKPVAAVTATKSHAGKDTIVAFAVGTGRLTSISYQSTNWALERSFVGALKNSPDTAIMNIENARLDSGNYIASAFLERFITDPYPTLFSTGTGAPVRRNNDIVLAITTNHGTLSTDMNNRSLPIHLAPTGNIEDRTSSIGNPKEEFLPQNREAIEAELRGMVERWKEAGMPLNTKVKHPFTIWAQTVGGILEVAGITGFLSNYSMRKAVDDPLRHAIGLLATALTPEGSDGWLRAADWAQRAVDMGLAKTLIPTADRDTAKGRERGIGVIMSKHRDETFNVETDDVRLVLRLEKARRRFESSPSTRYRFVQLEAYELPCEDDEQIVAAKENDARSTE
ncbi:MAG: hypothetical protein GC159_05795 [Phycisphaera sp.]|nr:hypothetical protein [Phycisphaera sp.]